MKLSVGMGSSSTASCSLSSEDFRFVPREVDGLEAISEKNESEKERIAKTTGRRCWWIEVNSGQLGLRAVVAHLWPCSPSLPTPSTPFNFSRNISRISLLPSGTTRPPTPSPSMNPPAKSGWLSGIPGGLPAVSLFSLSIVAYVAQVSYFDLVEDEGADKPRRGQSKGHSGTQESGRMQTLEREGREGMTT